MNDEKESGSLKDKCFIALFLAILLTIGVSILLMIVPWVPIEWYGPTLVLSFLLFVVGGGILVGNKDSQLWRYSLTLGFMIGVGSIILATIRQLSLTPVPVFGNALNVAIAGACGIGSLFLVYRQTAKDKTRAGLITTSTKSMTEQRQTIRSFFMQGKPKTVLAFELVEEPHDYLFADTEKSSSSDHVERFSSVVRTLFSTPYTICYQ